MPHNDLNLRIARAKGQRCWDCDNLPVPDYTVAGPASEGLVEELKQRGPFIMRWLPDISQWRVQSWLGVQYSQDIDPSRHVAVALVWLAVFEVKHDYAP